MKWTGNPFPGTDAREIQSKISEAQCKIKCTSRARECVSGKTVEGIADVAEDLGLGGGNMSPGEMTCTIGEEGD